MIAAHDVSGLILAGGQGRRMQEVGRPAIEKGLVLLHARPLVAWATNALPIGLATVYISANRYADAYGQYGVVVPDNPLLGHDVGPLAGVASALARASTPWLYVAPVDVPCPPPQLFSALCSHVCRERAPLAYVQSTRPQPLFMLLNRCLLSDLERSLQQGLRKVQEWQQRHGTPVCIDDNDTAFFNVNSPDDLALAHQRIAAPS